MIPIPSGLLLKLVPWGFGALFCLAIFMGGWRVGHNGQRAEVQQAEAALAAFQSQLALSEAKASGEAQARQTAALAASEAHAREVTAAVNAIPSKVAKIMQADVIPALRESVNDVRYSCLFLPYPDSGLRLLERPHDSN